MPKRKLNAQIGSKLLIALILFVPYQTVAQNLVPFRKGAQYGWVNTKGEVVIPARFRKTFPFSDGMARFVHNDRFGYINEKGEMQISNSFIAAYDFKNGKARVKDGPVWGFIDKRGKTLFTVACEQVEDFENGFAVYSRKGFKGYINEKGEEVFAAIFTRAEPFYNGVARVQIGRFYGLVSSDGSFALEPQYSYVGRPDGRYVRAKKGGWWHIFDTNEMRIKQVKYAIVRDFSEGMAVIRYEDKSLIKWKGYINENGDELMEPEYEWAGNFSGGVAVVQKDGLYGIINKEGRFLVPPTYEQTKGEFHDGLLGVKKDEKWGFVDSRGNWIIEPQFEETQNFQNGYAMVARGLRQWGCIDKSGKMLVPMKFDVVMPGSYYLIGILGYYKSYYSLSGELIIEDYGEKE